MCKSKIEWDEPIPPKLETQWNTWLEQLPFLSSFQIPRCYQPADFNNIVSARIHHLSDASLKSYGYVSYLRLIDDRGAIHCSFLFAKTKLTPLKVLTIPRLELCAATLSSNYDVMLHRELRLPYNLEPFLFWTDSTTVLKYINCKDKAFHVFVANRVLTIRNQSEPNQWKYVSTKQNPADFPSRGMNVPDFLTCEHWKSGPEFNFYGFPNHPGRSNRFWVTNTMKISSLRRQQSLAQLLLRNNPAFSTTLYLHIFLLDEIGPSSGVDNSHQKGFPSPNSKKENKP